MMSASMSRAAMRHSASSLALMRAFPRASVRASTRRHASSQPPQPPPPSRSLEPGKIIGVALVGAALVSGLTWAYPVLNSAITGANTGSGIPQAEIEFEKKRKTPKKKGENPQLITSQHDQVQNSWENPGVYVWGSNAGKVVAPDSKDLIIKAPRRLDFFDGQLLRDLKVAMEFGAAVTEKGDLVQWGTGYSAEDPRPAVTLSGKDITKLAISRDRILALSSSGSVYSIPVASSDQRLSATTPLNYRTLEPKDLGWREKVIDVRSGLEHALLLTSKGRVFSAASSSEDYPSKGQLGVPGLTWYTKPQGAYDQPHEIRTLKGVNVKTIATGDYHSVVLDDKGRVFVFGDNSSGQLGLPFEKDKLAIDRPSFLPLHKLYKESEYLPKVTAIAAGGLNSFFNIDAAKIISQKESIDGVLLARDLGRVSADTWAVGQGIKGSLGTGAWTHISEGPTKVNALSGLSEWDEKTSKAVPIRLASVSIGSTHAAAVMSNLTHIDASNKPNKNGVNWGSDVLWWGGNEFFQLGNGKRANANTPIHIGPLDRGEGDAKAGRKGEALRFQITPRQTVRLGKDGKGRKASVEQRVECGRYVTAVYSGA